MLIIFRQRCDGEQNMGVLLKKKNDHGCRSRCGREGCSGANSEHVMTRLESKVRETCIFGAFCLTYLLEWLGIKTRKMRDI